MEKEFNDFLKVGEQCGLLGIKITQNEQEIYSYHKEREIRRNLYSASKSFTSMAVGFAIQEGLLSLKERLVDCFPDDLPSHVGENLKEATVRDLLTMRLGQERQALMGEERAILKEKDYVKFSLSIPFSHKPDTYFEYSNVGPYLAGVLVQRRAGCDLVHYLMPRFFDHLGILYPTWEHDPLGYTFGAGGLFLSLSELHLFGQFYLQKGKWNGKQILSPSWIEESTKAQGRDPYGYLFWRGEYDSYRAHGKYEQVSMVIPKKNAVVSLVAECRNGEVMMRALYDFVVAKL